MVNDDREPIGTIQTLKIWDLPIRLFHWSIVILIGFSWWSAEQRLLDWHRRAGYAVLALLIFRVLWGFFGGNTARFASFIKPPERVIDYFRRDLFARKSSAHLGHNPLGGWSVLAMLGAMLLQTVLGLFAVDIDGLESGPFSYLVSFDTGRLAAKTHHLIFNVLLALIVLHIAAIAFYYLYKNQNLTKAMIIGKVSWRGIEKPKLSYSSPVVSSPVVAVLLLALSAGSVFLITTFLGR
jgi:cytochrome b